MRRGCVTAAFALPAPAVAAEKRADGLRSIGPSVTEFSAQQRRYRRHVHRYYGPRYGYRYGYRYRPYYYDAPYYAYAPLRITGRTTGRRVERRRRPVRLRLRALMT